MIKKIPGNELSSKTRKGCIAVAVITALKVNHPFIFVNHNFLYIIEIQTTSDIKRMNRRTLSVREMVYSLETIIRY